MAIVSGFTAARLTVSSDVDRTDGISLEECRAP